MARESWIDVYGLGHDRAKFVEALKHFECLIRDDERKQAIATQQQWVGLTDEEIDNIDYANWSEDYQRWNIRRFARFIEAKLKELNT
jgi:hypothetical protein